MTHGRKNIRKGIRIIPEQGKKPVASPEIHWPSSFQNPLDKGKTMASGGFPDIDQIQKRYSMIKSYKIPSTVFMKAMKTATDRIWILDKHMDLAELRQLENGFSRTSATNIRLLTVSNPDPIKNHLEKLRNSPGEEIRNPAIISVVQLKNLSQYIHDRFAILDQELWHFGANVGGAHSSLNAFSRGWDAATTMAESSFNSIWNRANTRTTGKR